MDTARRSKSFKKWLKRAPRKKKAVESGAAVGSEGRVSSGDPAESPQLETEAADENGSGQCCGAALSLSALQDEFAESSAMYEENLAAFSLQSEDRENVYRAQLGLELSQAQQVRAPRSALPVVKRTLGR